MVQLTNFFNDQQAQVSPSHSRIVDALIARQQPVATTPIQGIANLANTTLLAVRAKRQEEEAAARRTGIQQTIVEAIAAGQPSSREVANPVVSALSKHPGGPPPLLSRTVTETVPGSVEDVLAVLGSNPDTAGFALQMQLENLLAEPKERRTFLDRNGVRRYEDNGEELFSGVTKPRTEDLTDEEKTAAGIPLDVFAQRKPGGDVTTPFKPDRSGGPSLGQTANNTEIDAARRQLRAIAATLEPGVSLRDEIIRLGSKKSDTGMPNSDYDPTIMKAWNTATQRKVGADTDFEGFLALAGAAAPEPPIVEEPAAPEGPGLIDRALDFIGLGDDADADAIAAAAAPAIDRRTPAIAPAVEPGEQPAVSGDPLSHFSFGDADADVAVAPPDTSELRVPGGVGDVPLAAGGLLEHFPIILVHILS